VTDLKGLDSFSRVAPPALPSPVIEETSDALQCPRCGEISGLHHCAVQVQERDQEDGPGTQVYVGNGAVKVTRTSGDHYGTRRNAVRVGFWCEHCDEDATPRVVLVIRQHKGLTLVTWEAAR
jgi:hypothetical protein